MPAGSRVGRGRRLTDSNPSVKEGKVDEYLALAAKTDAAVMRSEPGMLHHTFDVDPDDPRTFVWSEQYADDAALRFHLANPPVVEYLEAHAPLAESLSVEVYGTLAPDTAEWFGGLGFPLKVYKSMLGASRAGGSAAGAWRLRLTARRSRLLEVTGGAPQQ